MHGVKTTVSGLAVVLVGVGAVWADEPVRSPDDGPEAKRTCHDCPMETIQKGDISGFRFDERGYLGSHGVIRDAMAWAQFWRRHTAHLDPPPPLPPVDFTRSAVLVAVQGRQPSGGGPSITIARVHRCDSVTTVRVIDDETPGLLDVITNPFHIVMIPAQCLGRLGAVEFVSSAPGHAPGMLVGRVAGVGEDGVSSPLAGALVRLIRPNPDGDEPVVVAETQTGKNGGYRFAEVRPGFYVAAAVARGYQLQEKPVQIAANETTVENFLLQPLEESLGGIRGQVRTGPTWEESDPLPDAHALLFVFEDNAGDPVLVDEFVTDCAGRYRFFDLEAGRYRIRVEARGYLPQEAAIPVPSGQVIEKHFLLQGE